MFTNVPPTRLRQAPIGSKVQLLGYPYLETIYTVDSIHPSGYVNLAINGNIRVNASPGHLIKVKQ